MIDLVTKSTRRAAQPHLCWECGQMIDRGEKHLVCVWRNDGSAYRLQSHKDCHEAAQEYIGRLDPVDGDDGVPPLYEAIAEGDGQGDLDAMRGHWPHVVCRIEFMRDLNAIRGRWPNVVCSEW